MAEVIYDGNTNAVFIDGLRNSATNTYVNDATVQLTLVDADDVEVTGETWPVSGTYLSGSDGDYQAVISTSASLTVGRKYTAKVTATSGGVTGYWEIPVVVRRRTF